MSKEKMTEDMRLMPDWYTWLVTCASCRTGTPSGVPLVPDWYTWPVILVACPLCQTGTLTPEKSKSIV